MIGPKLLGAALAALALAACSKSGNSAANGMASNDNLTNASAPANPETNSGSGNNLSATDAAMAKISDVVDKAQDTAAAGVGAVSASTLGSVNTHEFVLNAARSDLYEIDAAKVVEQRSKSSAVKKFAAQMIKDHTKTTKELTSLVQGGNIKEQIPTALDQRRQGLVDNLKSASADDLDVRYADQQVAAHEEAVTLMKGFADHGDNDQLKAFAAKTAPTVQMHLDMAKALDAAIKNKEDKVGGGTKGGANR